MAKRSSVWSAFMVAMVAIAACFGARDARAQSIVGWGCEGFCNIDNLDGNIVKVAAGIYHTVALKADGTVACWGYNGYGQCNVPADINQGALGPVIAIAAGGNRTIARFCVTPALVRSSGNLGAIGFGTPREFNFASLPAAAGAATLTIKVRADLNLASEYLTLKLDGVAQSALLFVSGANDCPTTPDVAMVTIPLKQLSALIADGTLAVRLEASPLVSATQCTEGLCEVSLRYDAVPVDCNGNGIEDTCEVLNPVWDCNNNDIPDACDIVSGFASDVNSNGRPDSCEYEYDCNSNGLPDSYELSQGTAPDCNHNGKIDSCDIAQGQAADIDANGIPDTCQGDCNGNALPDTYEIALNPSKDCDLDVVLDSCEIASGAQDKDLDGVLDDCEFARGDFNLDGTVGGADIAVLLSLWGVTNAPFGDLNHDGVIGGPDLSVLLSNWGPY